MKRKNIKIETKLIREGLNRTNFSETSEPIFMTSSYVYDSPEQAEARFKGDDDGFIYSRYGNPTVKVFEDRLASIEGGEKCFATSTGMAAVFSSMMCFLEQGDKIVASRALFGSCYQILTKIFPKYGISTTFVSGKNIEEWEQAIDDDTKAVFFETPSNPTLEIIDIAAVSQIAKKVGAKVVIDNVFATPILQKPLQLGVDIVVYSGTKHIDGQGRALGGAIISDNEYYEKHLKPYMRHTGASLSPFNAWIMLKGLETLKLRVEHQSDSALKLAEYYLKHKKIKQVIYPSKNTHDQYDLIKSQMSKGGTLLTMILDGGKKEVFKMLNNLEIIDISNNLGDTKSLITHPATTTHYSLGQEGRKEAGISDGMIRLSVGLENPEDLIDDLDKSLDKI
ncbi:MAG: O-succinylhomoserine sulfhydrylase [Chloroflexi bacterium]|nr:O-succinylhomoserine sulfhydrylase [Chloroflexota bacterium]|tara:strand:- start:506 stop:1687 length:1182 start_codon:yes stop_codon:yes gene_type:complete